MKMKKYIYMTLMVNLKVNVQLSILVPSVPTEMHDGTDGTERSRGTEVNQSTWKWPQGEWR